IERLELSPGNQTLTGLNVTRGDAGAYQGEVRNLVSTNRSEPSTVMVAWSNCSPITQLCCPLTLLAWPSLEIADTLLWLRNMTYLATDQRLELSPGNRTLTMLKVTRGDAGAYQCEVRNPISTNPALPMALLASPNLLGPITLGSPLTLMCVTDSVPPSHYLWLHNGTDANETGSRWTINPMTWDQQGTFVCQAHNPDTNLTAQASVTVRVTGDSWVLVSLCT
uniref:Ig-like domain-containing protein n=1 Tax=Pelusios castaneus TaxID=367368 RepID=A0A8C8RG36_9SAUR